VIYTRDDIYLLIIKQLHHFGFSELYTSIDLLDFRQETSSGAAGRRHPTVHDISNDVLVLSTQFDEPFAYSTNTWARGDDCHKDVRRFRPVQRLHTGGASGNAAQKMNVITLAEEEKEFKYWLKSVANPPNMKFIIPGRYLQFV